MSVALVQANIPADKKEKAAVKSTKPVVGSSKKAKASGSGKGHRWEQSPGVRPCCDLGALP